MSDAAVGEILKEVKIHSINGFHISVKFRDLGTIFFSVIISLVISKVFFLSILCRT